MVIMADSETVGNLEEQALKRKERLKNLKRKNANIDSSGNETNEKIVLPK